MGGVPTKHHSKSKVGRRRSQLFLKKANIVACPKCQGPSLPHMSCPQCGSYMKNPKHEIRNSKQSQNPKS